MPGFHCHVATEKVQSRSHCLGDSAEAKGLPEGGETYCVLKIDAEEAAQRESLAAVVEALNALTVTTAEKADDDGRLYGSVNAARIAELCKAAGCEVEEGKVRLEHPLKEVGEHKVAIHLFADLTAEVTVIVETEA